jgi:hypothetical protein
MSTTNPDAIFKIRRKSDGLYSTGGSDPVFTSKGKVWKQRSHVTLHLGQLSRQSKGVYDDCEIVELLTIEGAVHDPNAWIAEVAERREERERRYRERVEAWRREERRKQYENLRKEFGE